MPLVDGGVVLHAGIAALPGRLGDHLHELARLVGAHRRAGGAGGGRPVAVGDHGAHELVGHPHRMVGVLVGDRVVGAADDVEAAGEACLDQRPGLALLDLLALDEIDDVGMVDVEHHHLGGAPGLAAALDHAGEGVEALHEGHRPGGGAAAGQQLARRAQLREVAAGAGAVLEQHALGLGQGEDRLHGVLDRVDETGRALRLLLDADVEPHRRVEAGELVEQHVGELGVEGGGVLLGGEVAAQPSPAGDRVDHPADQLAHAALALRRPQLAAEVLGHHDVGGGLRPALRHLDAALLEHRLTLLVGDESVADLPVDGVERVHSRGGVEAREAEPRPGAGRRRRGRPGLGQGVTGAYLRGLRGLPGLAAAGLPGIPAFPGRDALLVPVRVAPGLLGKGGLRLHDVSPPKSIIMTLNGAKNAYAGRLLLDMPAFAPLAWVARTVSKEA